ncbi:hypothetical protein AAHA92_23020 [Salvia divinorum]|uniref:Uncharacterized protein n=1 Tax=Salvia divinorum TaxID=28513 RepID=A0ABD1GQL1_SALDI
MSRAFLILMLIGLLVLVITPSLARDLEDDTLLLDLNSNENIEGFEVNEMLNIESLKRHRHGHRAPPPHSHGAPSNRRRHAPPPHSHSAQSNRRRHAPPPHHRNHAPPPEMF